MTVRRIIHTICLLLLLIVAIAAAAVGYYLVACSSTGNGFGWALFVLVVFTIIAPEKTIPGVVVVISLLYGFAAPWAQKRWSLRSYGWRIPSTGLVIGLVAYGLSALTDAHESCSIGF